MTLGAGRLFGVEVWGYGHPNASPRLVPVGASRDVDVE